MTAAPQQIPATGETGPTAQQRGRRRRSIAIALALVGFVLIFYILTIVKMGPALFDRVL